MNLTGVGKKNFDVLATPNYAKKLFVAILKDRTVL